MKPSAADRPAPSHTRHARAGWHPDDLINLLSNKLDTVFADRAAVFKEQYRESIYNFDRKGTLQSTAACDHLYEIFCEELKARAELILKHVKTIYETYPLQISPESITELKKICSKVLDLQRENLESLMISNSPFSGPKTDPWKRITESCIFRFSAYGDTRKEALETDIEIWRLQMAKENQETVTNNMKIKNVFLAFLITETPQKNVNYKKETYFLIV